MYSQSRLGRICESFERKVGNKMNCFTCCFAKLIGNVCAFLSPLFVIGASLYHYITFNVMFIAAVHA